jgi:hypothetical protein
MLVLGGITAFAAGAKAQTYYSIDVTNDNLYTLNVLTGAATLVGPLGVDVDGVDMAWHQGALYAKSFGTTSGTRIFQIVTTGVFAGTALPGAPINGGGYQGAEAAGLASNGTSLYLTYSDQPPTNYYSTAFGKIDPMTGTITFVSYIPTDGDAMGYTGGQFWTIDVKAPGTGYDVYRGASNPSTFVGNDTYDVTLATNPVDIEYLSATELIAVSQTGRNLVHVNRTTGARGTVTPITGIPSNGFMKGIAREPSRCPQPFVEYH